MPASCCAYNCTNRHGKLKEDGSKLQFHRFPFKKPDLLLQWMKAVRRKSWHPTKASVLCGEHFTDDCYISSFRRYLKETAVPSLFNFSSHAREERKKRRLLMKNPLPEPKIVKEGELNMSPIPNQPLLQIKDNGATVCPIIQVLQVPLTISRSCQTNTLKSPDKMLLYRKINMLQRRLKRRDKRILELETILMNSYKLYKPS